MYDSVAPPSDGMYVSGNFHPRCQKRNQQFKGISVRSFCEQKPELGGEPTRVPLSQIPESVSKLLGGSWVLISRVISRVTILITHIRGLITLLITTPEPPITILKS